MKKSLAIMVALLMVLSFSACGKTKTLQCDGCDAEVEVSVDSNMDDDWIVYCEDCEKELEPEINEILDGDPYEE